MKLRKVFSLVFAVVLVAGIAWSVISARKAHAAPPDAIPRMFGALKGTMGSSLVFEDSSGTIRLVNIDTNTLITIQRR